MGLFLSVFCMNAGTFSCVAYKDRAAAQFEVIGLADRCMFSFFTVSMIIRDRFSYVWRIRR